MIEAGTAANQVIIESSPALTNTASVYELDAMDRWLTAIESDESDARLRDKIVANKPADLADGCYLPTGQRITEYLGINGGTGQCATLFPIFSNPRGAAGQRKTLDILKCHLAPIRFSSYPVTFTDAQRVALKAAFPNGVCDYQRLGVGQVPPGGTWLNYSDGPSREHWH